MNRDAYGFSLSFFLHVFLLGIFFYLFPSLDLQPKPLVIDFSLISGGSSHHDISAAVPKPKQHPKSPQVLQAPPLPKQLAMPKPIEKVFLAEPPEKVITKKVLKRPAEKILPKKEEKVVQEEPLTRLAEMSRPTATLEARPIIQPQVSAVQERAAVLKSSSVVGSSGDNSSKAMEQKYVKAHFVYIKKIIEKRISYPPMARRMGWQGKVVVSFVVCLNGMVEDLHIVESSGYAQLDKNALETVRQVGPFPAPPVRVKLVLPVTYKIS